MGVLDVLLFPEQAERATSVASRKVVSFPWSDRSGFFCRDNIFMGTDPHIVTVDCCFDSLPGQWNKRWRLVCRRPVI
jgi:hypothetical protein